MTPERLKEIKGIAIAIADGPPDEYEGENQCRLCNCSMHLTYGSEPHALCHDCAYKAADALSELLEYPTFDHG